MDAVVLEKFQKIQTLMERAGTVGEAESAAAALQRLMIKYNVDAAELEAAGKRDHEEYVSQFIELGKKGSSGLQWRINLIRVLAQAGFCKFIRIGVHGGIGYLVGQPSNIDAVRRIYEATVATVERLAERDWPAFRNRYNDWIRAGSPTAMAWKNSFKLGFSAGLWSKLQQEKQAIEAGEVTVSALVVVKDAELDEAVQRIIGNLVPSRNSTASNSSGFGAGYARGLAHETHDSIDA